MLVGAAAPRLASAARTRATLSRQVGHGPGRDDRLDGGPVARCRPSEGALGEQAQAQVEPQRPPPEPLAPRPVGAADGGAPVERAGRAPALARAVGDRRRALAVVDDPAQAPGRSASGRRRRRRAGRGRRPRRTCAAPGRTAPAGAARAVGPATQQPVSQLTSSARSSRYGSVRARSAAGWIAAGTSARTHGQAPTSGPLAEGWTDPSGLSTRGPTSAPSSSDSAASRSRPSSSSSVSGLSSTVASPVASATPAFDAAPKPTLRSSSISRPEPFQAAVSARGGSVEALSTTISSCSPSRARFIVATRVRR